MKHEQVVPDYWVMLRTSATCLLLVFSGYILLRMVQAIFWLPRYLEDNQKRLEEMVTKYSDQSKLEDDEDIKETSDDSNVGEKKKNENDEEKLDEKKKEK